MLHSRVRQQRVETSFAQTSHPNSRTCQGCHPKEATQGCPPNLLPWRSPTNSRTSHPKKATKTCPPRASHPKEATKTRPPNLLPWRSPSCWLTVRSGGDGLKADGRRLQILEPKLQGWFELSIHMLSAVSSLGMYTNTWRSRENCQPAPGASNSSRNNAGCAALQCLLLPRICGRVWWPTFASGTCGWALWFGFEAGICGRDLWLGPMVGACGWDVRQWARRGR